MVFASRRQGRFYVRDVARVDTNAYITGSIVAADAVVRGRVTGDITCAGEIWIRSTAMIEGNVIAQTAIVDAGAIFNGELSIGEDIMVPELAEKIRLAEKLLGNGIVPEVETIEQPAEAGSRVKKKLLVREESTLPAAAGEQEEEGGGWW